MLSEYEGLGVSLSGKFPDGLTTPSLPADMVDSAAIADTLFTDPHFVGWNLSREEVIGVLDGLKRPVSFQTLLPAMLKAFFSKTNVTHSTAIYKNNRYINHVETIRELFPDARFIFMLRDPRGVFNSAQRHMDIRTQQAMNKNPVLAAYIFRKTCINVRKFMHEPWFHFLKYEDLITNPESELERLLNFLGSDGRSRIKGPTEYLIPESQKGLHENMNQAPIKGIADKWKQELSNSNIWTIQSAVAQDLVEFGYPLIHFTSIPLQWHLKRVLGALPVMVMRAKNALRKVVFRFRIRRLGI